MDFQSFPGAQCTTPGFLIGVASTDGAYDVLRHAGATIVGIGTFAPDHVSPAKHHSTVTGWQPSAPFPFNMAVNTIS